MFGTCGFDTKNTDPDVALPVRVQNVEIVPLVMCWISLPPGLELRTGKEKWSKRGFDKGSLLIVDGHLIVLGEKGKLALAEATPDGYRQKAAYQVLNGKCWSVPVFPRRHANAQSSLTF